MPHWIIRPNKYLSSLALIIALIAAFTQKQVATGSQAPGTGSLSKVADQSRAKTKVKAPRIIQERIAFGAKRRHQMADYSRRHYGDRTWKLRKPRVIVQHYSVTPDIPSLFNTFASNAADPEFHERPNVCAHFGVARSGRIFQFVGLDRRCRHTVGLNHTAIGIEHVGYSDHEVLSNAAQMRGSLKLTRWLRCRYDIRIRNVIGHNESLSSPYHRELVTSMKRVTHGDFDPSAMKKYRRKLRTAGRCR